MQFKHEFKGELWLFPTSAAPWHFISVPEKISADLRLLSTGLRNAFGSMRVSVRIGKSYWKTSLFWDSKSQCFLLPVKAAVRAKEKISAGDKVKVTLELDI